MLSRPNELEEAYLIDACHQHAYNTSSIYTLSTFFDTHSYFGGPTTSLELPPGLLPEMQNCFSPILPATTNSLSNTTASADPASQQCSDPASFGSLDQIPSGLSINPFAEPGRVLPDTDCSCTLSLCSDTTEASISPHTSKRQSPLPSVGCEKESTPKRPLRKRGRPRLDHNDETGTSSASLAKQYKQGRSRVPHNQVERKYREGLNSEIEKLRSVVPTLPQSNDSGVIGQPKPSKAIVLAAAVDYIKSTERERDALREEIERIKYAEAKRR
jgi:hypothetical protein